MRLDGEAPALERVEQSPLRGERQSRIGSRRHRIPEESQSPLRRDRGIQRPQRSRRRVAGIREDLLALLTPAVVELLEAVERHVALAAHFDELGRVRRIEPERNVVDRAEIDRDDLALESIPARGAAHQHPAFVREVDRVAVDLELRRVPCRAHLLARHAHGAYLPFAELVVVERVAEREHRHEVNGLGDGALDRRPNTLRGRVRRAKLGILLFDLPQLPHHQIVFAIRDLGCVEHVIAVVRVLEESAELAGAIVRGSHERKIYARGKRALARAEGSTSLGEAGRGATSGH